MTEIRDRAAEVQHAHQALGDGCLCGWTYDPEVDDSHFDHQADEVLAAIAPYIQAQVTDSWLLGVGSCIALIEHIGALAAAIETDANARVIAEWSARVVHAMRSASATINPGGPA